MHVLLVSYFGPPDFSPRSARLANIGKALVREGHSVEVWTVAPESGDEYILSKLPPGSVHQAPPGLLEKNARKREAAYASQNWKPLGGTWRPWVKSFLFPERQIEWLAYTALHKRIMKRPDIILAFSPVFTSAAVARYLASNFDAPFAIDYGDPWSYRKLYDFAPFRRKVDKRFEDWVTSAAAGVVVTAQPQAEKMSEFFPKIRDIAVFTNGFDPDDYQEPPPPPGEALRYLGEFNLSRIDATAFGSVIEAHPRIRQVDAYGRRHRVQVPSWVREHGTVPFRNAAELMQSAGVLLLLGMQGSLQIPFKLFSYLGAGRPILALVEGPNDPVAKILAPIRHARSVNAIDAEGIATALDELLAMKDGHFPAPAEYSWRQIGPAYVDRLCDWAG